MHCLMNAPALAMIQRLRHRDGDACWLCGGTLDFEAKPNSKQAPTKEHLQSLSDGGKDELNNLVLCHPGCNRQLGARPRVDKEKIRARRIAKAAAAAAPKAAVRAAPKQPIVVPVKVRDPTREPAVDWRTVAWSAIAAATFFAGLALGLLLR